MPRRFFVFMQMEFPWALGPADGRYLTRTAPDEEPELVVVLGTLGAPQRRLIKGRRPSAVAAGKRSADARPDGGRVLVG